MPVRRTLTVRMHIDGAREVLRAFSLLPKEASDELRDASLRLADTLALRAADDFRVAGGAQGPLLAPTVKAVRDRIPAVQAGGTTRVGSRRAPAWGVLFGAVFGMTRRSGWYASPRYGTSVGRQYRPHQGSDAYTFFPVVERNAPDIAAAWERMADAIVRDFAAVDAS
ncbi:hypothetical protein [Amycolatopsis solani]|uniref:hypothetical protein n=1 Tax=Amycolatopsis solani TaxID=3028615 RepID=UPI0025B16DBC|nr:hypothetical protein [Amycolatopsis sp. MEP2-6]